MNKKPKSPKKSRVVMTEIVLPSHTNALGTIFGGTVLSWIDIAGAISASRHAGTTTVTASMDAVHFFSPIWLGQIVTIEAQVTFASKTSMEVEIHVFSEKIENEEKLHHVTAFATYVAVNNSGKPIPIPPLKLTTHSEKQTSKEGANRRKERLLQAKKMQKKIQTSHQCFS